MAAPACHPANAPRTAGGESTDRRQATGDANRSHPLGPPRDALFAVYGRNATELLAEIERLSRFAAGGADAPVHTLARRWCSAAPPAHPSSVALVVHGRQAADLPDALCEARDCVRAGVAVRDRRGVFFSPRPLGGASRADRRDPASAIVFPGSGNHFPGMGLDLAAAFPDVPRALNRESSRLATHLQWPRCGPFRSSWPEDWRTRAVAAVEGDVLHGIVSQVMYGVLMHDLLTRLGLRPGSMLGYSLGESTALLASRAWADRDLLFERLEASSLFRSDLAPPYDAVRAAWRIPPDQPVDWRMLLVGRGPAEVRAALHGLPRARLLIVNTPGECVVGGLRTDLDQLVSRLRCRAVELRGVSSVHCEVLRPVLGAYRDLHLLPTTPPDGLRFYSAHAKGPYEVTRESAADAIAAHALHGFDFAATVERAWQDGVRVFVEAGPQATCTRMIRKTLGDRPHLAISACDRLTPPVTTLLKTVAALVAERSIFDLAGLYGGDEEETGPHEPDAPHGTIQVAVGGRWDAPPPPRAAHDLRPPATLQRAPVPTAPPDVAARQPPAARNDETPAPTPLLQPAQALPPDDLSLAAGAAAQAHEAYLRFAHSAATSLQALIDVQRSLAASLTTQAGPLEPRRPRLDLPAPAQPPAHSHDAIHAAAPFLDRAACLQFARGRIADVLGPAFAPIDQHPTRVRLPDEPLMLVDRILRVEGRPGSLSAGRVVTEHDVRPDAWYLDGGCAPVCVAVEAGQADLFLCAWLGIDRVTGGTRMYRLLDAAVEFHRDLPRPGETVRYDIRIERFMRQGDTWLFAFRFDAAIGAQALLTMRGGRAGFFSADEVRGSRGIVLTDDEQQAAPDPPPRFPDAQPFRPGDLAPLAGPERYDDAALAALRSGNLHACFGPAFAHLPLPHPVRIPAGRMRLIDRILELDPRGGRYGRGRIRAEADIRPDDWFLTCHFVDDMTMPGTLMYECCLHTLRVLLTRLGWVGPGDRLSYQPVRGVESRLRCRGPVTPETRRVVYEVDVRELGFRDWGSGPEPYAIADALMYADGKRIVQFRDMAVRVAGVTRAELERLWTPPRTHGARRPTGRDAPADPPPVSPVGDVPVSVGVAPAQVGHDRILAFAVGDPSYAFGDRYRPFDRDRRIARLPGPPFQFLDRVTRIHARPWELEPGGWIETQYDVPPDAWYFNANRQPGLPFSVILEAALQPCGWLAAYLGSALLADSFLAFRNLGGAGTLYEELPPDAGTLTGRTRITGVSHAAGMIIEKFDTQLWRAGRLVYDCKTVFGFFSEEALSRQVGIRDAAARRHVPAPSQLALATPIELPDLPPLTPASAASGPHQTPAAPALPARAYRMIDRIDAYIPDGGPRGLGFVRGSTDVDPNAWFFNAHFFQDPVWPGSLGLESILQLLKAVALHRRPDLAHRPTRFTPVCLRRPHEWLYRGQITPANQRVEVEASVIEAPDDASATLVADGFLSVDGTVIYEMRGFGVSTPL